MVIVCIGEVNRRSFGAELSADSQELGLGQPEAGFVAQEGFLGASGGQGSGIGEDVAVDFEAEFEREGEERKRRGHFRRDEMVYTSLVGRWTRRRNWNG